MAELALCQLCRAPLRQGGEESGVLLDRLADAVRLRFRIDHALDCEEALPFERLRASEQQAWRDRARPLVEALELLAATPEGASS